MRVALISDPHGNLLALDAVLAELDRYGPWDQVVMGGDFAFGGPFPAECIDRIRQRGYPAVRGNTDEFIVEVATGGDHPAQVDDPSQRHGPQMLAIDQWVVDRLNAEQIDYLANLPLRLDLEAPGGSRFTVVHATPWSAHPAVQADAPLEVARRVVDAGGAAGVAFGHIHLQYLREIEGRLLVAVGSVGYPFDGDQRAAFAVLSEDGGRWSVEFRRVPYDVTAAIAQVEASTLPGADMWINRLRAARS